MQRTELPEQKIRLVSCIKLPENEQTFTGVVYGESLLFFSRTLLYYLKEPNR